MGCHSLRPSASTPMSTHSSASLHVVTKDGCCRAGLPYDTCIRRAIDQRRRLRARCSAARRCCLRWRRSSSLHVRLPSLRCRRPTVGPHRCSASQVWADWIGQDLHDGGHRARSGRHDLCAARSAPSERQLLRDCGQALRGPPCSRPARDRAEGGVCCGWEGRTGGGSRRCHRGRC